jgi:hypothetical protein
MKKSARVTLTLVATIGCAYSQQPADPCSARSFNPAVCQTAVKRHGYCDGTAWVPRTYQGYPYYYDIYQAYTATGGIVIQAPSAACHVPLFRGGFGAFAAAHHGERGAHS